MYPNLNAEMARKGITKTQLADALGITLSTLSQKLNDKYDLSFPEAVKIKKFLGVDIPLEELFEKAA